MNFSHLDEHGNAIMTDVSGKPKTIRTASASASVLLSKEVFEKVLHNGITKGDVISTARIAGIQAAKKTAELIPLCHSIVISKIEIDFRFNEVANTIHITASAKTVDVTGIEMEVLTAASIAALTIYDMCKSLDKRMVISNIHLISKTGGKSGDFEF